MADLEPIPYPGRKDPLDPRAGEDDRDGRRLAELEPPELLRDEVSAGQGLPRHPRQSRHRRQELLGETAYASLRDIPDTVDMVDMFRASPEAPGVVADAIAIGAKVALDAARRAQRRGGGDWRRPPGIEVIMNRCPKIEFGRLGGELSWSGVNSGIIRNRPPAPPLPRRIKARPAPAQNLTYGFETRAIHAGAAPDPTTGARVDPDLPDGGLRVRRRRPRRLALQPARFRLHLFAPHQPDRRGARGADREPRRRPRGASPPARATRRSS